MAPEQKLELSLSAPRKPDLSSRGVLVNPEPKRYDGKISKIEMLFMAAVERIDALELAIEEISAKADLAAALPKQGTGGDEADAMVESFGIKSTDGENGTVTLYGGWINHMGRTNIYVDEPTYTMTILISGGSSATPSYITLRIKKTDGVITIRDLPENPQADDGTYWNRVLWEAYKVTGTVTVTKDRRPDWNIGSPL